MRVLICGGRDYDDWVQVVDTLDHLASRHDITRVIIGGAPGADALASAWATLRCVPLLVFAADWAQHGRAAGPIRNQRMLDDGKPDVVVAFPGGRGTADMVRKAKTAGVKVLRIGHEGEHS